MPPCLFSEVPQHPPDLDSKSGRPSRGDIVTPNFSWKLQEGHYLATINFSGSALTEAEYYLAMTVNFGAEIWTAGGVWNRGLRAVKPPFTNVVLDLLKRDTNVVAVNVVVVVVVVIVVAIKY